VASLADEPVDVADRAHFFIVGQAVNEHGQRGGLVEPRPESLDQVVDRNKNPYASREISDVTQLPPNFAGIAGNVLYLVMIEIGKHRGRSIGTSAVVEWLI
jgi:hypothetical protein